MMILMSNVRNRISNAVIFIKQEAVTSLYPIFITCVDYKIVVIKKKNLKP